jgi:hypothetical protein
MSNFLARLVERQWGQVATVQPRTQSMFAPDSHAASFQVVDDAVPLQPHVDGPQEPGTRDAEQAKQEPLQPEQQSQERSVSRPAPLVPPIIARPVARPLLGSETSAEVERQAPSLRLSVPPAPVQPVPNVLVGMQTSVRQDQAAEAKGTTSAQSIIETTLIPTPPWVEPRAQDLASAQRRVSAPVSLLVAEPASERSSHFEPRAAEPPVHVTIGRIEVTAVTAAPAPKRVPTSRKATMPLQDYLARRRGQP